MKCWAIAWLAALSLSAPAFAEPASVCAENKTEHTGIVSLRELTAGNDIGPHISSFSVKPSEAVCVEWRLPAVFGLTISLPGVSIPRARQWGGEIGCLTLGYAELYEYLVWVEFGAIQAGVFYCSVEGPVETSVPPEIFD